MEIAFQPHYMELFKLYPSALRLQVGWEGKPRILQRLSPAWNSQMLKRE